MVVSPSLPFWFCSVARDSKKLMALEALRLIDSEHGSLTKIEERSVGL